MLKTKSLISFVLTTTILIAQVGAVFAAPAFQESGLIAGTVQSITLKADINTGITTVLVTVLNKNDLSQTARINLEAAIPLGLVTLNSDGNPVINNMALGQSIEVDPAIVIPDEEPERHPIGSALATFFSKITGLDYDKIMGAHDKGLGFGVIAQALWLTMKFDGDSEVFLAILDAKETGDYSAFVLDDGTIPKNWGQLRKAILDSSDKKGSLGIVISNKEKAKKNDNRNNQAKEENKDKINNGNDNGKKNGNGNGNGNGQDK
jgi:hypothetical protein